MAGNDANTVLLLPMLGANGETALVDRSMGGGGDKAIGNTGVISTTDNKFDGSSLFCFGGGEHVSVAKHDDFSFSNLPFTVDGWFKVTTVNQCYLWAWYQDADNYCALEVIRIVGDTVQLGLSYRFGGIERAAIDNGVMVTLVGGWHHVALVRSGTALTLYVDGVVNGSATISNYLRFNFHLWPLYIGKGIHRASQALRWIAGYIDEFRVHRAAYWTTLFTPPRFSYFPRVLQDFVGQHSVLAPVMVDFVGLSDVGMGKYVADFVGVSDVEQSITVDFVGLSSVVRVAMDCVGVSDVDGPLVIDFLGVSDVQGPVVLDFVGLSNVALDSFSADFVGVSDVQAGQAMDLVGTSHVMRNFELDFIGLSDVETNVVEYRLYHRLGAPVNDSDYAAAPWATSASLPMTVALTGQGNHYFVIRRTNKYGFESQNRDQTIIELDGSDNQLTPIPSGPNKVLLARAAGNMMDVVATYQNLRDEDREADEFKIWLTSDGSTPNPAIDPVTTTIAMVKADGVVKLNYNSGPYTEGQTIKVIVRAHRSSDSRDDGNTTVITASTTAIGPAAVSPTSYHRSKGIRKRAT